MKLGNVFAITSIALLSVCANAQDANSQVKVKIKGVKIEQQQTPQMVVQNVVEKRWKPKQWIELDSELDVDIAADLGGKEGTYPSLEFKYFIAVNQKTKEGKNIVLSGSLTYENIPASRSGDTSHALAYVTPATLKKVLLKDNGGKADVSAIGIEIHSGGQMLQGAYFSSTGNPWWIGADKLPDSTKFEFQDGAVIPKSKTPFAPLWGDYDLQSKAQP